MGLHKHIYTLYNEGQYFHPDCIEYRKWVKRSQKNLDVSWRGIVRNSRDKITAEGDVSSANMQSELNGQLTLNGKAWGSVATLSDNPNEKGLSSVSKRLKKNQ